MKKGPKRDWAERAAESLVVRYWNEKAKAPTWAKLPLVKHERRIAAALRRARKLKESERKEAEKQGIIWAYNHYEQAELLVSGELRWAARERDRSEG